MGAILCIDDDEKIIGLFEKFLTALGHDIVIAKNGKEGIKLFENGNNYKMVITDIQMPLVDGNRVARHIRQSGNPNTPIIAITGSEDCEIDEGLFNYIIFKPFRFNALLDRIRVLL